MSYNIESMVLAVMVVIIFLTVVTLVGEMYAPLKDWLKIYFIHHWIGKGVLGLVLFIAISTMPVKIKMKTLEKYLMPVLWVCVLALFVFFIWHYFTL